MTAAPLFASSFVPGFLAALRSRLRAGRSLATALLVGATLAGCGGGSADAPPPPEPGTPPPAAVAPTITQQPASVTVTAGQPASFTVAATGTAPLAYQWQRNGVAIAGATSTTYTVAATVLGDSAAAFRAVVSNVAGSATSDAATLTVTVAAPVLTITPQPANATVVAGASASFTVGGTCSSGTLAIQWQRLAGAAFADIAGATAATYSLTTAIGDNAAQFRAVLSCSGQSSTPSSVATLTVGTPSAISLDAVPLVGLRSAARIGNPRGITRLPSGDYVYTDGQRIRRLAADLSAITTVAGALSESGSADGAAATARFRDPYDVVADSSGTVYVADRSNATIRKIAVDGTVSTLAGTATVSGYADGTGAAARFSSPSNIALGPDGDLYVSDNNSQVIRRVTAAGVVTTYAGTPNGNGLVDNADPTLAKFSNPAGLAIAPNGDVYLADQGNSRIRRIARAGSGAGAVSTVAGASDGSDTVALDGPGLTAGIPFPSGVTIVGNTLYIRDGRGLMRAMDLTTSVVSTLTGDRATDPGRVDGPIGHARLNSAPSFMAAMPGGGFVLTDFTLLRTVSATGLVTTIATGATNELGQDDSATGVLSQLPLNFATNATAAIAFDISSNSIVWYEAISRQLKRIDASGNVTLVAGMPSASDNVDGQGSGAGFFDAGLAVAAATDGTLYVYDSYSVRRVDTAGNVVRLSGSPTDFGAVNGDAASSRYNRVSGLAVGPTGDVFAGDFGNAVVRRISATGSTSSYAGVFGSATIVDGPIATARFRFPGRLAFKSDGTLYVADNGQLRRISADGATVSTLSGPGTVTALAVDSVGNVYCNSSGALGRYGIDGSFTVLVPTGSTVVTGNASPSVGTGVSAIALRNDKQIVVLAQGQLLQVNLP